MKHHLMIKKCMTTGLQYLCKTSSIVKDPYAYKGSGVRWLNHIKKYNSRILTCIIGTYDSKEELVEAGIYYSNLYNVVKDPNWANLTEEKGDGGLIGTGQLGKRWKIKDTSNMKKAKTQTESRLEVYRKSSGKNNYQFKGMIKTPWGIFETAEQACKIAKLVREKNGDYTISDRATLKKYLQNLDTMLNLEGRRTPKEWRGKTPRALGFDILKDNDGKN
jgi:hypothetical protein